MKKLLLFILLALCGAGSFNAAAQAEKPKTTKYEIRHQGMERSYWLYIPENLRELGGSSLPCPQSFLHPPDEGDRDLWGA